MGLIRNEWNFPGEPLGIEACCAEISQRTGLQISLENAGKPLGDEEARITGPLLQEYFYLSTEERQFIISAGAPLHSYLWFHFQAVMLRHGAQPDKAFYIRENSMLGSNFDREWNQIPWPIRFIHYVRIIRAFFS